MIKNCESCGREFTGRRSTARYCSSGCRQVAFQRRRGRGGQDLTPAEVVGVVGELLPAVPAPPTVVAAGGSLGETVTGPAVEALGALIGWLGAALDSLPADARGVFGPRGAKVLLELLAAREALRPAVEPARPAVESKLDEFRRRSRARKLTGPTGLPYEVLCTFPESALDGLLAAYQPWRSGPGQDAGG
jgi:hypothetical protein